MSQLTGKLKRPMSDREAQIASQSDDFRSKYGALGAPQEEGATEDDYAPHWERPGWKEGYIGVGPVGVASGTANAAADARSAAQFESELASAPRMSSMHPPAELMSESELGAATDAAKQAGDAGRVKQLEQEMASRNVNQDDEMSHVYSNSKE